MEDHAPPSWLYILVLSVVFLSAVKKLFSHLSSSASISISAALGATLLLAERVCAFFQHPLSAILFLVFLAMGVCVVSYALKKGIRGRRRRRNNNGDNNGNGSQGLDGEDMLSANGKAVFITGCDSGFGHAAALHLDALGFTVFATVMDIYGQGARELKNTCSDRLTVLQVDITQPQQVQQAFIETKAKLGPEGLWGLVNNAGVCVNFGDIELSLMSNFRGCMEVNFFGTLNVTKTFLPLLRQARGRIVTVSSPAGDLPFPCLAAYGSSKAALNLFINTLRHELEPWGVHVSTILPSSYKTGQSSNASHWEQQHKLVVQSLPSTLMEEYGEEYLTETKDLFYSHALQANPDLSPVTASITAALLDIKPRDRYLAGRGVGLMYLIHTYAPFHWSNAFLKKLFVKKTVVPNALRKKKTQEREEKEEEEEDNNNNNKK